MWESAIRALSVIGGLGLPAAVITALALRSKLRAEAGRVGANAAAIIAKTSADSVTEVRADMAELRAEHRAELVEVNLELRALRRHVAVLEGLLRKNGLPVPEFAWPPTV